MNSPADSLTEDIDLLIASIGLLSSISDGNKRAVHVYRPSPSPRSTPVPLPVLTPTSGVYSKDPPCDVPHGIEEESCPSSPIFLRLDVPKRYSDQETSSSEDINSAHSLDGDDSISVSVSVSDADAASATLSTPSHCDDDVQRSSALFKGVEKDELSPSVRYSTIAFPEDDEFPVLNRLHIEHHFMSTHSSQVLPPSPGDLPPLSPSPPLPPSPLINSPVVVHRPLPVPPGAVSRTMLTPPSLSPTPKLEFVPHSEGNITSSSSSQREEGPSNNDMRNDDSATAAAPPNSESPRGVLNHSEFSKLYKSNSVLFGTHSRTRSAPVNVNELRQAPFSSLAAFGSGSGSGSATPSTIRPHPGRSNEFEAAEYTKTTIDLFPMPPKSPPPVPQTLASEPSSLSRQASSVKPLPSQLRYQLSQSALRRPRPPNRLPPLHDWDDRPRPQTEFRVDDDVHPSSGSSSRDPRFGALPYTSPPGKTHFSIHPAPPPPIPERSLVEHLEEYPYSPQTSLQESSFFEQHEQLPQQLEKSSKDLLPDPYDGHHHYNHSTQLKQFHRGPSSPSVFSEIDMTLHNENRDGDFGSDDDDGADARSFMSNPLDGIRSPISPDDTIFLEGRPRSRPRSRKSRIGGDFDMAEPKSFFDLGFDMDIGRLEKRSKWKFWSKITKHYKD